DDKTNRIDLASFDGQRWSAPQTIITGSQVDLDPAPAVRPGTKQHSLVTVRDSNGAKSVVRIARYDGAHWITSSWRDSSFVLGISAVTASEWADRSVTLVVMGFRAHVTGVYAIRGESTTSGYTWSAPQLIDSLAGTYQAFSSARLGADSLVVVWYASHVE